ncbi:hypothetical protein AB1Y20_013598 [Prymnesium parvum]|uniref:PTM/DIR17-like Tudor domain-containing protein n=1 Tax=Prymnesium parvum TaxID=97485 RepID=A0AB34IG21_PRYPA
MAMHFKKLASHNSVFKKAFVRGCTDRLREIEVRLDHGCSAKWLRQLEQCEDLAGVARLLLALQRRTPLHALDNAWLESLESLDPSEVEEQQAELSRRLMHRLDEIDRAVAPARKPAEMLGETVLKHFEGHGTFMGTIVEYDEATGFRLQYDDGDTEDVTLRDLRALLPRDPNASADDLSDGLSNASDAEPSEPSAPPSDARPAVERQPSAPLPLSRKKQLLQAVSDVPFESKEAAREAAGGVKGKGGSKAAGAGKHGKAAVKSGGKAMPPAAPPPAAAAAAAAAACGAASDEPIVGSKRPLEVRRRASAPPLPSHTPDSAHPSQDDELAQLPPGWLVEQKGGKGRVFISPDGLTRFSTLAKVQRWHRQQMALASRFQSQAQKQSAAEPPVAPAADEPPRAASPSDDGNASGADGDGSQNGKGGRRLPRELRNLALPDREWKLSQVPAALGAKGGEKEEPEEGKEGREGEAREAEASSDEEGGRASAAEGEEGAAKTNGSEGGEGAGRTSGTEGEEGLTSCVDEEEGRARVPEREKEQASCVEGEEGTTSATEGEEWRTSCMEREEERASAMEGEEGRATCAEGEDVEATIAAREAGGSQGQSRTPLGSDGEGTGNDTGEAEQEVGTQAGDEEERRATTPVEALGAEDVAADEGHAEVEEVEVEALYEDEPMDVDAVFEGP